MKKLLALLLAVIMVLSMAACGASEPAPEAPKAEEPKVEAPKEETPVVEEPAGDPVYINENAAELTGEVRLLTAFGGALGTEALIAAFNEHYPNVTVTFETYTNNADGNMTANTALQAGNADVILSFGTHNTAFRWENGMLADITDRLAADNLDLVKEWGTDAYKYNDRVYCFPSGGLSIFVALNMTAWEEAGL